MIFLWKEKFGKFVRGAEQVKNIEVLDDVEGDLGFAQHCLVGKTLRKEMSLAKTTLQDKEGESAVTAYLVAGHWVEVQEQMHLWTNLHAAFC